MESEQTYRILL